MRNNKTATASIVAPVKALASPVRLRILALLKDPVGNFPPQRDGDLLTDGVCAVFIRQRLDIAAATVSRHLNLLVHAGFLIPTRKKGWTFYRRDERAIRAFARSLRQAL